MTDIFHIFYITLNTYVYFIVTLLTFISHFQNLPILVYYYLRLRILSYRLSTIVEANKELDYELKVRKIDPLGDINSEERC